MRRLAGLWIAVALLTLPLAAKAQDQEGRRASLFDLGIYAGGAWTSDWFEVGDEGFSIGIAPIFGTTATYWTSPSFGIRLHGAYMPSQLPEGDEEFDDNDWHVNNWLYDLDLVFRPWLSSPTAGPITQSTYVFFGVGGITTNGPGFLDEGKSAFGGHVGIGANLFDIGPSSSITGELGIRGYQGPVDELGGTIDRKLAWTVTAGIGVAFGLGERTQ